MRCRLLGRAGWGRGVFCDGSQSDYRWRLHGVLKMAEDSIFFMMSSFDCAASHLTFVFKTVNR